MRLPSQPCSGASFSRPRARLSCLSGRAAVRAGRRDRQAVPNAIREVAREGGGRRRSEGGADGGVRSGGAYEGQQRPARHRRTHSLHPNVTLTTFALAFRTPHGEVSWLSWETKATTTTDRGSCLFASLSDLLCCSDACHVSHRLSCKLPVSCPYPGPPCISSYFHPLYIS